MADYKQRSQETAQKLKDPRWQKKRLEILNRDEWACQKCYDDESTLIVHHRRYLPEKEPWDYPDELLITLCESCHEEEREKMSSIEHDIVEILKEKFLADEIHDIAQGFLNMELPHLSAVVATMLEWVLSDRDILYELTERYFLHLHEKAEARKKVENGENKNDQTTILDG
jgi:cytochrome c553